MSKRFNSRAAGAAHDEGGCFKLAKAVAGELAGRLAGTVSGEERRKHFDAFADGIRRIHDDVCRRDLKMLKDSLNAVDFYRPITQRRFSREAWDLRPDTWDDPRFEFAVGLDRVRSRHTSRRLGASPFPLLRKAREWLAAMDEEVPRLRRLPLREAGARLPDVLKSCVSAFVAAVHDQNADMDSIVSTCVSTLTSLIQRANLRSRAA
ncbi:MAG: hypothetical protein MJZ81_12120 [Bacteroidales bacterium]|nr:hypothetical protein [Bacteroidales bacterium]